ncbi:serine hydrolase [Nakamurella sp. A5-74]|uniref:Serine hydrolase n=1 Tax=Nakamurella sp. A5-74 TaxID=3158264 RepID=A0AAU8DR21_9ACTN
MTFTDTLIAAEPAVRALLAAAPAEFTVSVAVDDLHDGGFSIDGDQVFRAASVIKVPVMTAVLEDVAAQRLSLDQPISVDEAERVEPSGVLYVLQDVPTPSVRDLLTLMIVISDNMATNLLIDAVGMDRVNASMQHAGLTSTVLRRRLNTTDPAFASVRNEMTAADAAHGLVQLARAEGVYADSALREVAMTALRRQQHIDLLPRHLPEPIMLAHKTGSLDGLRHDAGILLRAGEPVAVVAVFADATDHGAHDVDPQTERALEDLTAEIGRVLGAALR